MNHLMDNPFAKVPFPLDNRGAMTLRASNWSVTDTGPTLPSDVQRYRPIT